MLNKDMRDKKIRIGLEDAKANIFYHSFNNVAVKTLVVSFKTARRVLSTREGFKDVRAVGNNSNPPVLWDMIQKEWDEYLDSVAADLGYKGNEIALLSTGVDIDNLGKGEESFKEFRAVCLATAGVVSNSMRMGKDKSGSYERNGRFFPVGTINIILLTNASLSDGAMARAVITITEAKTSVLQDMDIRSSYTPLVNQATGTGTDNILVVSGGGPAINYVGGHCMMGELIAGVVSKAVKQSIEKQHGFCQNRLLIERLRERKITLDSLVEAGLQMYIPDPEIGDTAKVRELLGKELEKVMKDVNVASLVLAGLKLEEDGQRGAIPCMDVEEYKKDPVYLIADEMLGIQIATYIGGSRALFEFERFDRKKPGIFKDLPPILDDVLGGLVSGAMVKICSA